MNNVLPALSANNDLSELYESIEKFNGFHLIIPSKLQKNLLSDAALDLCAEFDELFDEVILPNVCDSCAPRQKCSMCFRGKREGFIPSEFDTLFLGLFRTNKNN